MPVGLHLVDKVESQLSAAGLLPADRGVVHRVIDFAKGDFTLRWAPSDYPDISLQVNLKQQLTGRAIERPVMLWRVEILEIEEAFEEGRLLYIDAGTARSLAVTVGEACERILAMVPGESVENEPAKVPTDPTL